MAFLRRKGMRYGASWSKEPWLGRYGRPVPEAPYDPDTEIETAFAWWPGAYQQNN